MAGATRKHFQQVASVLKEIPDEGKRRELAQHHADIFAKQNPLFDRRKFFVASGVPVSEDTVVVEGTRYRGLLDRIRERYKT